MLLFLNLDCVLTPPADALGPLCSSDMGLRRLEGILLSWPALQLVVTSDRRYRMTLEHFRGFFAAPLRSRPIGTTSLYWECGLTAGRTREDEVLEWLKGRPTLDHRAWLIMDRCMKGYVTHRDRLLVCTTFTRNVVAQLHAALNFHSPVHELAPVLQPLVSPIPDPASHSYRTSCSGLPVQALPLRRSPATMNTERHR